jgi:hypothetical protein
MTPIRSALEDGKASPFIEFINWQFVFSAHKALILRSGRLLLCDAQMLFSMCQRRILRKVWLYNDR